MSAAQTARQLATFEGRGAGTDAERRAAQWLAVQLRRPGREVKVEPFWCRPNWALAHAWHVVLALAGSLVSVSSPRVGGALLLAALISVIADERLGISPGRRLTPERASQNVIATRSPADSHGKPPISDEHPPPIHLIITANYDAGRTGLVHRDVLRSPFARAAAAFTRSGPLWLGWLGWLAIAIVWLLVIAILRLEGDHGTVLGVVQLIPTAGLVLALALLLELGSSHYGPAASDNGSGVDVAVALMNALDAAPPPRTTVEVVLQGSGDGFGIGLRRYLAARRRELRAQNPVVVGIAPCGAGHLRWWISDGQLVALRYLDRLAKLCAELVRDNPGLTAAPHRGRGATPAFRATSARCAAIAIGCLDAQGRAPRSHQSGDRAEQLDPKAMDATLEFGLLLADAVGGLLRERPSGRRHGIALRRPLTVLAGGQREPADQL